MSPIFATQLERLPALLGAHIVLTVIALALGLAISLPAAFLGLRQRALQGPLLAVASIIQTIPSLAILALMVAAFGLFGQPAALIALTAYSVLPILRNTITGIEGVDPAAVEAARGIGMTRNQILWRVQLPLAAPIILAGIRTATVWVVGIATLATPVGADSLGSYIFGGLQTRNTTAVLFGVVSAAALAIALDSLIHLGEVAARKRSRPLALITAVGLALILAMGVWPKGGDERVMAAAPTAAAQAEGVEAAPRRTVMVGAKTFTESYILARLIRARLSEAGYPAQLKEGLGSAVVFDALRQGEIDVYVDYSGTIWANAMKRTETLPPQEVLDQMSEWLEREHEMKSLGALGFENAYGLALREDAAAELGVDTISELVPHTPKLSLGSDFEFFDRPEWTKLRDTYGLAFDAQRAFDPTLMYPAVKEGDVDVITAFTTDGRIAAFNLRVLPDDKHAFPPYDAVLLLSPEASKDPDLIAALAPLIGAIDSDAMRTANKLVDVDRKDTQFAAQYLLDRIAAGDDAQPAADDTAESAADGE
ncbi:glycine betaine ABC transporter substrate-binding protein [Haliangium ochraceum]|uniref:Substrate-binding region of ABC-type glycine betaine transport system n=1 Tax=Haliangium ochraceum (strain DSM 14365 / JCM 11303 / SMP-2) TaxID=502025 RepID=D0LWP1_HALO1|nr:glycine betaine ABC transporter substrate-binding protein [Haliangium ochraceum]ACY17691.1 Substrate-binding region of ABC-type glycine betaine transport system [Haliangium ochraceum DSM 14365]